jgi:hypothetical protein
MAKGAITLAQGAAKTAMLEIACSQCGRRSRRNVQKVIVEYGANIGLPDLKEKLAKRCLRLQSSYTHERCGVHYPRLPEMFWKELWPACSYTFAYGSKMLIRRLAARTPSASVVGTGFVDGASQAR